MGLIDNASYRKGVKIRMKLSIIVPVYNMAADNKLKFA